MVAVPAVVPVTVPEAFMLATAPLLLLQVPPGVTSDNEVVSPAQAFAIPLIAAGVGLTITFTDVVHPAAVV